MTSSCESESLATNPESSRGSARSSEASGVYHSSPERDEDEALVERLRRGDRAAAEILYFRYVELVRGVCFKILGPSFDHEDLLHDIFVECLTNISTVRDPKALRSWLIGVSIRMCRRRIQGRARKWWLRFRAPEDLPEQIVEQGAPAAAGLRKVYDLLEGIPPEDRIALVLTKVEGMTLPEGAEVCGVSLATFKRRLKRANESFLGAARQEPILETWFERGGQSS